MEDQAIRYCKSALASRHYPPSIDLDELVQEYNLGELESGNGPAAVMKFLGEASEDSSRRQACRLEGHAAPDIEPGETDESVDAEREFEEEIIAAINTEKAGPIYRMLENDIPTYRASVFRRYFGIGCDEEPAADIADSLGIAHHQVNDIVAEVVRVIRRGLITKQVNLPLYGTVDEVRERRVRAWRQVKQKRAEVGAGLYG